MTAKRLRSTCPGTTSSACSPFPPPAFHVRGRHAPEPEFPWISGTEATIEMLIRRPSDHYRLVLDVVPNGVGGRLQTLEVFFNGFRMAYFEVPIATSLSMELPAELFNSRVARFNLRCENAVSFCAADPRKLGIAVAGWCIA